MTIGVSDSGDYPATRAYLKSLSESNLFSDLDRYGQMGVDALSSSTPVDTGLTASSWGYRIVESSYGPGLEWFNTDLDSEGQPIAILIQYGHGTGTGGYVRGRDFINPAIQPIFDEIMFNLERRLRGG